MWSRPMLALLATLVLHVAHAAAADVAVPGDYPTIQAAIEGAAPDSVIQISPGHYAERLVLHQITRGLTIRGSPDDPSAVVVDGGGVAETLSVTSCGANIAFEGITITGGRGKEGYGGGLFMADSAVAFHRCVFTGNSADLDGGGAFLLRSGGFFRECEFRQNAAGRYGGGLMINLHGTSIFDRCRFENNESGTAGGLLGSGGGVHVNDSSPTFLGCRIANNRARSSGGGIIVTGHFSEPESHPTLHDCTIVDNEAVRADPSHPAAEGGGIHIEDNVRAVLQGCRVRGNTSNNGGGVNSYRAHYEITNSVIEDNLAVVDAGLGGYGGGLYIASVNTVQPPRQASTIVLAQSLVRGNQAAVGAGVFVQGDFLLSDNRALLEVLDSVVADNVAADRGGGITVDRTDAGIRGSHVLLNRVTASSFGFGGGLLSSGSSAVSVEDTTIAGNEAGDLGGGIFIDQGGRLDVTDSRLFANVASSAPQLGGGAIAVGQSSGPTPGPVTGLVQGSVLGENGSGNEIWESDCDAAQWSTIAYRDNVLHSPTGRLYYRNCSGVISSAAQLNTLSTKASGNADAPPRFASLAAAPVSIVEGDSSALAWCVAGGGGLALAPDPGPLSNPVGTVDVTPTSTTPYALLRDATPEATATVTVRCNTLGTPIPCLPSNGEAAQPPGDVTLHWYPAPGTTRYDLLLGESTPPADAVALGVASDRFTLSGLRPGTRYFWRVVARNDGCVEPTISPTFEFTTCALGGCPWVDAFDDGDASDWSRLGAGTAIVVDGALQLSARRKLTVLPPAPHITDGTISFTLSLRDLGREIRVLFGYIDERNYRALVIRPRSGRWMLQERSAGRLTRVARTRRPLMRSTRFSVRLDLAGAQVTAALNDAQVFSGAFSPAPAGPFGIRIRATQLEVDDVRVALGGGV